MITLISVNEFTVFRLLLLAGLGRKILVLDVEPLIPRMRGALRRLVERLVHSGRAARAIDTLDELRRVRDVPGRILLYDVFGEIEPWQNEYFHFRDAERSAGDYAMAYKMTVTNYVREKHVSLLVLQTLFRGPNAGRFRCVGLAADLRAAARAYIGAPLPGAAAWIPARPFNLVLAAAALLVAVAWALRRARPGNRPPEPVFVAADFIADPRDVRLYQELEEGGPMLMVPRAVGELSSWKAKLADYRFCALSDGVLPLKDLPATIAMAARDEWRFFRHFGAAHPALFWRVAMLPYRRLLYRGLFTRFRPKFFWGRDLYNAEHIVRRQELNRVGGKSFGVNTGYLTWSIVMPASRYVSFDRYYVFGRGKYEKYYGDTWAKDMEVVPAGSFTADRVHYARRFDPRPPDIAVFVGVLAGEPEMMRFVRGLAAAFPDRKVLLQVKSNFAKVPGTDAFIDGCRRSLANVKYTTDSVYDIFLRARYGFSDPSSVVVEAMQFGMVSFAFDLPQLQKANINREYPGLCVETADQAVARIRDIESGKWTYPIEAYRDVVDLSGTVFFDRVRRDMGLMAKEPSVSLLERRATGAR